LSHETYFLLYHVEENRYVSALQFKGVYKVWQISN
jgi:hypothetical protein